MQTGGGALFKQEKEEEEVPYSDTRRCLIQTGGGALFRHEEEVPHSNRRRRCLIQTGGEDG